MISTHFVGGILVLASLSALAVTAQQNSKSTVMSDKNSASQNETVDAQKEGERIFKRHCSRCHTAPDGFSPRISGTVVRHMRVRASLSQHQEEALLRYFNP